MPRFLFDIIHDSTDANRTIPVTMEEFLEFGLSPIDYSTYVALFYRVQSDLILNEPHNKSDSPLNLIAFCIEKHLADPRASRLPLFTLSRFDAEYCYDSTDWMRYPMTSCPIWMRRSAAPLLRSPALIPMILNSGNSYLPVPHNTVGGSLCKAPKPHGFGALHAFNAG